MKRIQQIRRRLLRLEDRFGRVRWLSVAIFRQEWAAGLSLEERQRAALARAPGDAPAILEHFQRMRERLQAVDELQDIYDCDFSERTFS